MASLGLWTHFIWGPSRPKQRSRDTTFVGNHAVTVYILVDSQTGNELFFPVLLLAKLHENIFVCFHSEILSRTQRMLPGRKQYINFVFR